MFAGSLRARQRAANVMTLVQSAKLNGHDPYVYLKDVLVRPPAQPTGRLEELFPHQWRGAAYSMKDPICGSVQQLVRMWRIMPLNIRNEKAEELASALAKLTGETKTEAVTQALLERLERVRRARAKRRLADELDEIALHCAAIPVRDKRSADEIIGYDEHGLPR